MICTNCNQEVPVTAKVCGHCGHRLKVVTPPPTHVAQSTTVKQGLPGWVWGLGGVLIALLIGVSFYLWMFLGKNRPLSGTDLPSPTTTLIPSHIPVSTQAPTMTQTAGVTPTTQPTRTATPIRLPAVGIFPDVDSLWNSWVNQKTIQSINDITVENFHTSFDSGLLAGQSYFPYTLNLKPSQSVIWNTGWCALNKNILEQNMAQINFEFYINGETVSPSEFGTISTPSGSFYCSYTFTELKDWSVGTYIITTVKDFKTDINDGVSPGIFPAGRKVIEYTVRVSP